MDEHDLFERDAALAQIDVALAGGRAGQGCALLLTGQAGIGKTSLFEVARARAAAAGMSLLTARSGQLESDVAFGVVRQLFEPPVLGVGAQERRALFEGAAGLAAPLLAADLAGVPVPGSGRRSAWAVLHGLYWLTANLAARRPLLIAVDDVHWTDRASLRSLSYLTARLEGLPVTVLLAARSGEPSSVQLRTLLRDPALRRLSLSELSRPACDLMVRRTAGAANEQLCAACHEATGGNPFLLKEVLTAVATANLDPTPTPTPTPTPALAASIREMRPSSTDAVAARLERLPAPAAALARAAAVLGRSVELRHAAALAGIDVAAAAVAADLLAESGLLRGRPLEFVHPIVQGVVYDGLPAAARAVAHRRSAGLLAAEGSDPVEIGAHLLVAEPAGDPAVVQLLRHAAAAALSRGAPEGAAVFLRRALAEPAEDQVRGPLFAELGRAELLARDPAALEHLGAALELVDDQIERLRLSLALAEVLYFQGQMPIAHAVVTNALESLHDADDASVLVAETARAFFGWGWKQPDVAPEDVSRLTALALRGGPDGRGLAILVGQVLMTGGAQPEDGIRLVRHGLDGGRLVADESADAVAAVPAGAMLAYHDDLTAVEQHLEQMLDDARARGSIMGYAGALTYRALAALRRGAVDVAASDAARALELGQEHELNFALPFTVQILVEALLEKGEVEQCSAALSAVVFAPLDGTLPGAMQLTARGRLNVALGRTEGGLSDLRGAGAALQALGVENPNLMAWRSTLALALPAGQASEREDLVAAELVLARRAGQDQFAIGVALRASGLLSGGVEGIGLLEHAVRVLQQCPSILEQARSLVELGGALRRANRRTDAREPLRQGIELAGGCGATALEERGLAELRATGARPRGRTRTGAAALTPTEQRVVVMAAQQLTNPEIAQALFVARKTVENHLVSAFRKLDVHSREELAEYAGTPDRLALRSTPAVRG